MAEGGRVMSHAATNWAIIQRGLKPATKIVLWHLADCHNPAHGCFPSQDYLAEHCEMSRSSLNEHLAALEAAGLIRRERRRDARTRRQENTRYHLACEADFDENPCPENGHGSYEAVSGNGGEPCPENGESRVQNLDTNPVREPVKEPERERAGRCEEGKSDSEAPEGLTRRAEALFFRSFKGWDRFDVSPKQPMLVAWAKLTWGQMEAAADAVPRFLAAKKASGMRHAPAISTYLDLRERLWEGFPAVDDEPSRLSAPVFGPVWSAVRMRHLLAGPGPLPKASKFLEALMERDDEQGRRERSAYRARWGFPAVNAMHTAGERGGRWIAAPGDERLKALMEQVKVGTERWEAWREEHRRRGWPWLPDPGRQEWIYFPAGGPEGLQAFEAAIRGEAAE